MCNTIKKLSGSLCGNISRNVIQPRKIPINRSTVPSISYMTNTNLERFYLYGKVKIVQDDVVVGALLGVDDSTKSSFSKVK